MKVNFEKREDGWDYKSKVQLVKKTRVSSKYSPGTPEQMNSGWTGD